jgi:hypothetical protein
MAMIFDDLLPRRRKKIRLKPALVDQELVDPLGVMNIVDHDL